MEMGGVEEKRNEWQTAGQDSRADVCISAISSAGSVSSARPAAAAGAAG